MNPNKKYNICHLAYTFYEEDSRVMRYVNSLSDNGYNVDVICLKRSGQSKQDISNGIRIFRIKDREVNEKKSINYLVRIILFLFRAFLKITLNHLIRRYDIIHIHNLPDFLVFSAFIPKILGAKIILDIHDILPELYISKFKIKDNSLIFKLLLFIEKISCRFANHVIVANDLWREKLIKRAVPSFRCTSLINYPDTRIFKPFNRKKINNNKFIILYPGTLNYHQGVDIAVKAFSIIKDRIPQAEFHIYGEGPALPYLKKLIKELNLDDKVFIYNPVSLREIAQVISLADLGIIPKRAEGFGGEAFSTKSMEFMASGVPVIMARTKIDTLYFTDDQVKFFPSDDFKALSEAIWELYSQPEKKRKMVEKGFELVSYENWENHKYKYLNIIHSLLTTDPTNQSRLDNLENSSNPNNPSNLNNPSD